MQQTIEDNKVLDEQKEATGTRGSLMDAAVHSEDVAQNLADRDIAVKEEYKEKHPEAFGDDFQLGEKSPEVETKSASSQAPANNYYGGDVDFDKLYDDYRMPKNGADYIKQLWSNEKGGKAAAIGNVIGNLLTGGEQWKQYQDNYIKEMTERNSRRFNDGMDLLKRAQYNKQDLDFLQNQVNKKLGMARGMSSEDIALLQSFNQALQTGGLSSLLGSIGSQGIAKIFGLLGL